MKPISATISLCLFFLVAGTAIPAEREPEKRRIVDTTSCTIVNEKPVPPVFEYSGPRGHHGQRISKQSIKSVLIWDDGTIAWEIMKDGETWSGDWYRSTVPAEKVEKAVQAVVESFKKYPVENRPLVTAIRFWGGAHVSPQVTLMAPDLYEKFWMDDFLFRYCIEKRDDFRSGNEKKMVRAMRKLNDPLFNFKRLVDFYREDLPHAGLSKRGEKWISDEELKKCAELFAADAEHLLLMEKRILDLVPSHEGLEPKKFDHESRDVKVEEETPDGKRRFVYSLIAKEETEKVLEERRKQREKQ